MINIIKILMKKYNIYIMSDHIYCVKSRKKTASIKDSEKKVITKNNKHGIESRCSICNSKKFTFIKKI